MLFRNPSFLVPALAITTLFLTGLGCGDDTSTPDGGVPDSGTPDVSLDTPPDVEVDCTTPDLRWSTNTMASVVGVPRTVRLGFARDYCVDATIELSSGDTAIATVVDSATVLSRQSEAQVVVTPVAIGITTITARILDQEGEEMTATLNVEITEADLPDCTGSAEGAVVPGVDLSVADGSLSGIAISIPEGASRDNAYHVDNFDGTIACADDIVPDGFRAIGKAVAFGPNYLRFNREIRLGLPARVSLLPENAHLGHLEVAYVGPGTAPRIVPVAFETVSGGADAVVVIAVPRLGTYQMVVRDGAGVPRDREFTHRGILGVSMGGAGVGSVGFRNPDRFDFAAPLGTAWDWTYLADYMRRYHLGGFCTAAEFAATPEECNAASVDRTPEARWIHEVRQDFEHWEYRENFRGHGSLFNRIWYLRIFRDIARMFGNPNTDRTLMESEPNITPPGVPDSERERSDSERCSDPVVIETGYFDDEYNPDGSLPAVSFCDGGELVVDGEIDNGVWDPAMPQTDPFEVALFIDRNRNGTRDPGEPVVRSGEEQFEDCGTDRLCNESEPGFDAVTNPDPAGDDYDYQYNPNGTEANFFRDGDPCDASGETFVDFGLDGVDGTPQLAAGGFDTGEGNGCWDRTRGFDRMKELGPREALATATDDELRDLNVFSDGGIRDLFNFAVAGNHTVSALPGRGAPLRYYNEHSAMHLDGRAAEDFVFTDVDYLATGPNVMLRYGDPDATDAQIMDGDGGHLGGGTQALDRVFSAIAWMSERWPGGDRDPVADVLCDGSRPGCDNPNQITFDFTSPTTGRVGPSSILLPPGYFDEEFADETYPVVYFLHGYGQEPEDLLLIGVLLWNFMNATNIPESERIQKMIFVFPDGRCRGDECLRGTFYTNAPSGSPGAAQMETFLLDLMDHVDENYRARGSETLSVID